MKMASENQQDKNGALIAIHLSNGSKVRLPLEDQELFRNLQVVAITACDIQKISKNDLAGLENLKQFCVDSCQLTFLPADLLSKMRMLEVISFSKNKIQHIGAGFLLAGFKNSIYYADFSKNMAIDSKYDKRDPTSITFKQLNEIIDKLDPFVGHYSSIFREDISSLWTTGQFSDFTIKVQETEFKFHKSILGVNSSIFAAMFKTELHRM